MQFKTLFVALGLAVATSAAAIPEPNLEKRVKSAPFKIRRFSPQTGFNENDPTTWTNNQYTGIAPVTSYFTYDGVSRETAANYEFDPATGTLRGANTGSGGLVPRNLQSYETTVAPVTFGGAGEPVKVTIGPAPLYEVKFQTSRNNAGVAGWTSFTQLGSNIFLGKSASIANPIRFRAEGYTPPQ